MLEIIKTDGKAEYSALSALRKRSGQVNREAERLVSEILENVQERGDAAVREYTVKFDGSCPEQFEVSQEEIRQALEKADQDFIASLLAAVKNISEYHSRQVQQSFLDAHADGVMMGQRIRGLSRVGLYVPGGTAAYPSSVLMNCIPAKIAGVGEIIMTTPPGKDGTANPDILVAAAVAGVDRVFLIGGAQAAAALAYGTESVPRVDKIVGPGNLYVATAKKLLYGTVDIDMIAGPSEILIIADETANPAYVAADMMSQAEHDRLASSILLTTSLSLAEKTLAELERQKQNLSRQEIIEASLEQYGMILVCRNMDEMVTLANEIAPEHCEIMTANPMEYLGKIDNVGSLFLGQYAPEPVGDYFAGPNHVLPTSGTARFFSPLGVDSFVKKSSYLYYTKEALSQARDHIVRIAKKEGLTAHANSIEVRFHV